MDKPLLRLNQKAVQGFFGFNKGVPLYTLERYLLHTLSSGSMKTTGRVYCEAHTSHQGVKFWVENTLENVKRPYPNTDFNWDMLYG